MQEIEELERKLNNKQLDGIYLLYGEERFLLENILKKIKKCFGEMINGINYIQIDADNINQLVSDIETPALAEYIKENIDFINESVTIVFVENDADKNNLYKAIDENGCVCNFEKQKPYDIAKRLKGICNAYKVNVDGATLNYLIENCGTSLQDLINEIRKQIEYVGENGTITKQTIDLLAIKQFESIIFD